MPGLSYLINQITFIIISALPNYYIQLWFRNQQVVEGCVELFSLYRVLLPIAGFCLVVILLAAWALRRNQHVNGPGSQAKVFRIVQWLGIIFILLDLGWLGGYWLAEVERPIHITAPYNDQTINFRLEVKGNYKEIPADQTLWVVVAPFRTPLYYPQQDPAIIQPNGTWTSLTFVGTAADAGQAFDILLVLVNQPGEQAFTDYLAGNPQNGLNGFPPGVTIVDKVTVWRK
jgi:hypothetical protein